MRFTMLMCVIAFIFAACSSDGPENSSASSVTVDADIAEISVDEVELETVSQRAGSEKEWNNALAASWRKENPEYSESQADCVGQTIVEEFSIERLGELGVTIDVVNEAMAVANFSTEETEMLEEIASQCFAS